MCSPYFIILKSYLYAKTINTALAYLSHDVASGSGIMPCNKIDKPLVVYIFSGNAMTSIITSRKISENLDVFTPKMHF